jgi:hypothetical protein
MPSSEPGSVDLYWLPLGAGGQGGVVRWSGRTYEAVAARHQRRPRSDLYHSALEVRTDGVRHVVEMTPVWGLSDRDRGVLVEGPVGMRLLGRSRLFRYEVHSWADGIIPDAAEAVGGPRRLSHDAATARRVLDLVRHFPACTWGRDEQATGDMWNSNSLTSWLLARSGHDITVVRPPDHGRAPGWSAGLVVARRTQIGPSTHASLVLRQGRRRALK